jgi:cystathionine beta-lyase/cystathionine gamma-synthase
MQSSNTLAAYGFSTQAVHGGTPGDSATHAVNPGIITSVNFSAEFGDIGFSAAGTNEDRAPYVYAREGHPNAKQLEQRMTLLEQGADAVAFASGMAAISGVLLHLLAHGGHVVVTDVSYAGTAELTRGMLRRYGVQVSLADMSDLDDVRAAIRPSTRVIYAESPCNPILKLVDLGALAKLAREVGAILVVDSTFASPAITRPLTLGADIVVHSLTKYCGGHGDAVGGIAVGRDAALIDNLRAEIGTHLGAMLSPFNAWLIMRGLETLAVRMAAYSRSATAVARFLESHPTVSRVIYPGLPSHPQYAVAQRQMALPSGMIAFTVADPVAVGQLLRERMRVFSYAASLGESRSLILYCDTADLQRTTFQLDDEHLRRYRELASEGIFRLSIGLEDPADLCADLERLLGAPAMAAR